MIKTTALAIGLAITAPLAVQAETLKTEGYDNYQVSCTAATCGDFDVNFAADSDKVAQTRRTRTRTRRGSQGLFKDNFVGGGAGLFFGDGLDIGGLGHVFFGTRYNENFGAEIEFTFGFAGVDGFSGFGIDETATLLGVYINPRYEYKFDNSNITVFGAVGIGLNRISFNGFSDTDFDIQLKAGAMRPLSEKLTGYAQTRIQRTFDTFGVDGGVMFDI